MEKVVVNNYGSFDVAFAKSKGSTMWDINGKKYIDFIAGIGVNCLGHNYKPLVKAIAKQAKKQIHISNYYFSDVGICYSLDLTEFISATLEPKQMKLQLNLQESTDSLTAVQKERQL